MIGLAVFGGEKDICADQSAETAAVHAGNLSSPPQLKRLRLQLALG